MKTKLEHTVIGIVIAPLAPLAFFLAGWWTSYSFLPEAWIPVSAVSCLVLGILADIFLLRKLLDQAESLGNLFWVVVFIFYSAGLFGFFMGVPVFNVVLVVPAGFILASRLLNSKADYTRVNSVVRRAAGFTTAVMLLVCVASATFALIDPYTEAGLRSMFSLPFDVTRGMVVALILIGGAGLLIVNWWLTILSTRASFNILQRLA